MTIEDQIKDEKLQYDINREAAKISAISSGKIDKYEYLTGEEILPSNQQRIIEQAKFTYSPLGKAFEKQTKTIEDQGKKQVDALVALKPKEIKSDDKFSNYFINELAKIRESYETIDFNDLTYYFKDSRITPVNFIEFKGPIHIFKSIYSIYDLKHEGTGLKILTPNQMLKRLPVALAQIKAGNNSESLLNEIRQIVYSLYRSKNITKKVYNNIIKSIKV